MNFLKKLFAIGSNVVVEAGEKKVDSLVDIRREGNGIIRNLEKSIGDIEKRVKDAQVNVSMAKSAIEANNVRIAKLNMVVKQAVNAGDDEDAINALNLIDSYELTNASNQSTVDDLSPLIKEQLEVIRTMRCDLVQMQGEITRMDIEEKSYKAKLELMGGAGSTNYAFNIDGMRERVQRIKAKVEAEEMVKGTTVENLEKKYSVGSTSSRISVQERLEKMKAEASSK